MRTTVMILAAMLLQPTFVLATEQPGGSPGAGVVAQVLDKEIRTRDAEELRYLVLRELVDRYAEQHSIAVTQDEIAEYLAAFSRAVAKDRVRRLAERRRLQEQLQSDALSDKERQSLTSELRVLNELLDAEDQLRADEQADSAQEQAAREQVAAAFILQWKINRSLYREYGGRVIFQQGGPEPLDAYRRFLEERQRAGDFEILDPGLEAAFWRYYRSDAMHSFYSQEAAREQRLFELPWWTIETPEQLSEPGQTKPHTEH